MSAHLGFIVAAYTVTAAIVIGMVAALVFDHRTLRKTLARFPARPGEGDAP